MSGNFSWCKMQQCEQLCMPTRMAHSAPLLRKLWWLPVWFQVQFQVLFLIFETLHDMGLGHLRDLRCQLHLPDSTDPAERTCCGSYLLGNYTWWDLEAGLLCHGDHLVESSPPGSEVISIPFKIVQVSQAMLSDLLSQGTREILLWLSYYS